MVTVEQAEKLISAGVLKSITSLGFEKWGAALLVKQKPDGVAWQLRFGARKDAGANRVLVGVFAGIRFDGVESFRDRDLEDPTLPSISIPIHFLHQDRRLVEWEAVPESVDSIVKEIENYALPFFRHYENLSVLLDTLSSPDAQDWLAVSRNERPELLAAILAKLGKVDEARKVLIAAIDERRSKPPGHRIPFERMLERIPTESDDP